MSQFHDIHNLIISIRACEFLFQSILNLLCKQIKTIREESDFLAMPTYPDSVVPNVSVSYELCLGGNVFFY